MKEEQFTRFLAFLERLDRAKIAYRIEHSREHAIMVLVFAPGEYWEVEFLDSGEIDVERYRSDGKILNEDSLEELFALWSEDQSPDENSARAIDVVAQK
jgi:hypothetical protein